MTSFGKANCLKAIRSLGYYPPGGMGFDKLLQGVESGDRVVSNEKGDGLKHITSYYLAEGGL
jgi:hypothetical protein